MILIHFGIKRGKYCVPFNGLQNQVKANSFQSDIYVNIRNIGGEIELAIFYTLHCCWSYPFYFVICIEVFTITIKCHHMNSK